MRSLKKLLITGFEPFGGQDVNPSWEAVKGLPDVIGDFRQPSICGIALWRTTGDSCPGTSL